LLSASVDVLLIDYAETERCQIMARVFIRVIMVTFFTYWFFVTWFCAWAIDVLCNCTCSDECLYNTDKQLLKRLRTFCRDPAALRARKFKVKKEISVFYCTSCKRAHTACKKS